jgi:hypothetical protein
LKQQLVIIIFILDDITRLVNGVNAKSSNTFNLPSASRVRTEGMKILADLAISNSRLEDLGTCNSSEKNIKQKIASSSYEIAKFVKALIHLVDQ